MPADPTTLLSLAARVEAAPSLCSYCGSDYMGDCLWSQKGGDGSCPSWEDYLDAEAEADAFRAAAAQEAPRHE